MDPQRWLRGFLAERMEEGVEIGESEMMLGGNWRRCWELSRGICGGSPGWGWAAKVMGKPSRDCPGASPAWLFPGSPSSACPQPLPFIIIFFAILLFILLPVTIGAR